MFSQASVILLTGGAVCLSACWDTPPPGADTTPPQSRQPREQTPPWEQTSPPPGADTPQGQTPPPEQTPPGADTSPRSTPPRSTPPPQADTPPQSMLEDTVNVRAVRILLECSLVFCHAVGSPVITHPSLFEASLTSHLLAMGQP